MRYAESYTTFLKYCASRFNQPIEKLIPAFQQNTIEDKFLKLYHSSNRELSSESYYELLEVAKSGIRTRKKSDDTSDNTIYLRLSIMIELLMEILHCSYSYAYMIITKSETYYYLVQDDYATTYDSPQANLDSIGEELRQQGDTLGSKITAENIIKAMQSIRDRNLRKAKSKERERTE